MEKGQWHFVLFFAILSFLSCTFQSKVAYDDVLRNGDNWVVEQQPGGKITIENNVMEITDAKGCTVWFKHKLEGNIKIEYDVTVIDENGPYDRVSDMNCFWMATDPKHPDDFFGISKQRAGYFPNYHELKLYYVGYGGHNNTKTRFRRYNGNANRPLLPQHDLADKEYMIVPNRKMHIELVADGNRIQYVRDREVIFEINDPKPYTQGYFGFRTVNNHMKIENFEIVKL